MFLEETEGDFVLYPDFPYTEGERIEDSGDPSTGNALRKNVFDKDVLLKVVELNANNFAQELPRLFALKMSPNNFCRVPYNLTISKQPEPDGFYLLGLGFDVPLGTVSDLSRQYADDPMKRFRLATNLFVDLIGIVRYLVSYGIYLVGINPRNILYWQDQWGSYRFMIANTAKSFLGPRWTNFEHNYADIVFLKNDIYTPPESTSGYYDINSIFYSCAVTALAVISGSATRITNAIETKNFSSLLPREIITGDLVESKQQFEKIVDVVKERDYRSRYEHIENFDFPPFEDTFIKRHRYLLSPPVRNLSFFQGFVPQSWKKEAEKYPKIQRQELTPIKASAGDVVRKLREYHVATVNPGGEEWDWIRVENMLKICADRVSNTVYSVLGKNYSGNLLHFIRSVDCLTRCLNQVSYEPKLLLNIVDMVGAVMYKKVHTQFESFQILPIIEIMASINFEIFNPELDGLETCLKIDPQVNLFDVVNGIVEERKDIFTNPGEAWESFLNGKLPNLSCNDPQSFNSAFPAIMFN